MIRTVINGMEFDGADGRGCGPSATADFDKIRRVSGTDYVKNFWHALADDAAELRATWDCV